MNIRRVVFYSVLIGVFLAVVDWFFHGVLLANFYESTSFVWRLQTEISDMWWNKIILYLVQGYFYYMFYSMFNVDKFTLGMGVGFICAVYAFSMYVYLPLTLTAATLWALCWFVHALGSAIICSLMF